MSATPAASGLEPNAIPIATPDRAVGRIGVRASRRMVWAIGVVVIGVLALTGAVVGGRPAPASIGIGAAPQPYVAPLLPAEPVDDTLTLAIPPGAAADKQAGGRGYRMPDVIHLTVGDTIVLRNDDDAPHMILYAFLMPGETDVRTLTEPGSEVYSAGCGVHGASILNFTTIFISEPA